MSRRKTLLILGTAGALLTAAIVIARVPTIKIDGAVMAEAPDPGTASPDRRRAHPCARRWRRAGSYDVSIFSVRFDSRFRGRWSPARPLRCTSNIATIGRSTSTRQARDSIYLARMSSTRPHVDEPHASGPAVVLSDLVVRYSISTQVETSIGSGARQFQVVNTGNVPCDHEGACSPDGKWKASVATVSMDAGADNQFRNARLSCIAGPCPFTRVDSDALLKRWATDRCHCSELVRHRDVRARIRSLSIAADRRHGELTSDHSRSRPQFYAAGDGPGPEHPGRGRWYGSGLPTGTKCCAQLGHVRDPHWERS